MGFSKRLNAAMEHMGVSQAALAHQLDVSAATVSSWCTGAKQPTNIDRLETIAKFLRVSPGYLQFGEERGQELTDRDLEPDRARYSEDLTWYWRPAPRDRGRELGNAAAYAFEPDIPTLARESAQNICDEKLETVPTVEARYVVGELTGAELTSFLRTIKFDEIRPHLEEASQANHKAGSVIRRGLAEVDEGRILYIRIDDFDAHGLTGPEFERGRFMAVARNVLDSQKSGAAGGSYGLGWATLPATSQFGLVLCNSHLSVAEMGLTENRFIGVIDLPWHAIGGEEYAGRGWLGLPDAEDRGKPPQRTKSYWGNQALARDVHLDRPGARPGASFLIVAAYDASGAVETIEEMAEQLCQSLADSFWPAMVDRPDGPARLQAIVRAQRNRQSIFETYVNPARYQPAKVAAFLKHLSDDVVESLEETGDVVRQDVLLSVPARTAEPKHGPQSHESILLVAQAGDEANDRTQTSPGTITYLRGSHMVVSTPRVTALPIGARPFHAIVLAGEAAGDAPADRAADRFLRASEPPAHNRWTGTPEVKASYARGGIKAIRDFDQAARAALRDIIRQPSRDLSDGPEALKELIRIQPPTSAGARPRVKSVRRHEVNDLGSWVIEEATITLPARPDGSGWTLLPVLRFGTESGAAIPVKWVSLDPIDRCELDGHGRLITPPTARTAVFTAVTDPTSHPVAAQRAKVLLDVRTFANEAQT